MDRTDIGDQIPDISLTLPDDNTVKPSDYLGQRWVLYFYPKDDTSGCTKEAQQFSELKASFAKAGVSILGVSKDPPKSHNKFIAKYDLSVPLASDEDIKLADALGIWVEKSMYGRTYMGMERTTYLIDSEGKVEKVWRKVKVKDHAQAVLDAALGVG